MKSVMWALVAASLVPAGSTYADQMVVTYRSGRVQTLHLDEPSSAIQGITYRADSPPKPGAQSLTPEADTAGRATTTSTPEQGTGAAPADRRPKVRMEWAQPLE